MHHPPSALYSNSLIAVPTSMYVMMDATLSPPLKDAPTQPVCVPVTFQDGTYDNSSSTSEGFPTKLTGSHIIGMQTNVVSVDKDKNVHVWKVSIPNMFT